MIQVAVLKTLTGLRPVAAVNFLKGQGQKWSCLFCARILRLGLLHQNCRTRLLEAVSKPHLSPDGSVAGLLKMLTYFRVCCAFSSACALPSNLIWSFETASILSCQESFALLDAVNLIGRV